MTRTTIDFGIHLGGDYCVIARMAAGQVEVISAPDGAVLTPTAAWLDRNNQLQVGKPAALQLDKDTENTAAGFINRLGTTDLYHFKRDGRSLSAEELAAEEFKVLLGNALQQTGEEVLAAVISIPAGFELSQRQAVVRAARLAGLRQVRLISEMDAAVYAHMLCGQVEGGTWLVFHLGPYSFETAVIQKDGAGLRVLSYLNDYQAGDKLITQAMVDTLLAPAAGRDYHLTDFQRSNLRWRKAFAKLDAAVETARNRLTDRNIYTISFDILCSDDNGEPVPFEYDLKDRQVITLAEPILKRCVALSLHALAQTRLPKQAIDWAIPVGEATLSPLVDEYLNNSQSGLGIPLNFNVDPLTVTVQGAAIFASSQPFDLSAPVSEVEPVASMPVEAQPVGEATTQDELNLPPPLEPEPAVAVVEEMPGTLPETSAVEETPPPPPVNREELTAWLLDARTTIAHVIEAGQPLGDKAFQEQLEKIVVEIDQAIQALNNQPAQNE